MSDVEKIADVMRERYGHVRPASEYVWPYASQRTIDCVLSLNRKYNGFVKPRVEAFTEKHPNVRSLSQLKELVARRDSPHAFFVAELNYDDRRRADTLVGVMEYLLDAQFEHPGANEDVKLYHWATWSRPGDYLTVGVRGFGLAGFQYLRMLFGAQTVKPDVHIVRFVCETLGKTVTDVQALNVMERAAKLTGLPLREVDGEIWKERAKP